MQFNEYKNTYIDTNECTSRGACSVAPNIAYLQELIMAFLKQIAYYIIKIEALGANNPKIKYDIINDIASLISINEFSEKQLYSIILKDYYLLLNVKNTYNSICTKNNLLPDELKKIIKFDQTTNLSKAIAQGEKLFLEKYKKLTSIQKNLIEIQQIVIKSLCINLIKLTDFEEFSENTFHEILETLNMYNRGKLTNKNIKDKTDKLSVINSKLQLEISKKLLEKYGNISKVEVSHSTRSGKAILVSGNNFIDLLNVLENTLDKNIDVYTHSNLLITHALKEFNKYPNLIGHYGDTTESCILDFATFPGSILLTKNSRNNTEYLYRGRLYSNDYIVHQGVVKIENNNLTPLIESALSAKGFSKGKIKDSSILGYDENEINEKISTLIENLKSDKIKNLYIIGMNNYSEIQKEYFKEFFKKLKNDEFAISFSHNINKENILSINIGNYAPLVTNILHKIFEKYPISDNKIVFFFSTCDVVTISNIIMLKSLNSKNIYMSDCPPTQINPNVFQTFRNEYQINITTEAEENLRKIRQK